MVKIWDPFPILPIDGLMKLQERPERVMIMAIGAAFQKAANELGVCER